MESLSFPRWPRGLCPVRACGAVVVLAEIDGREVPLNPVASSLAVADEDGRWRVVSGLQPHAHTCVDIDARHRFRARWEAGEGAEAGPPPG